MAVQILVEEEALKNALAQAFSLLQGLTDAEGFIVYVEEAPHRSGYGGLDEALIHVNDGLPVIMLAMSPAKMLANDPRFHLAMSWGNVHFVDALQAIAGVGLILSDPAAHLRPDNLLARDIFSLPTMRVSEMRTIRHDLGHAQRADKGSPSRQRMDDRWMPIAKGIFGEHLSREELVVAFEAAENLDDDYAPLCGRRYECFCCDAERTLIGEDGQINAVVLEQLDKQAKTKPVVIWTGGDVESVAKILRANGIAYAVISKQLLRGATVAEAIDDESYEEFCLKYGVVVDHFTTV